MSLVATYTVLSLLLLLAFLPPVLLAVRLRNAERRRREPWRAIVQAFLWGALGAALASIVLEGYIGEATGGADVFFLGFPLTIVLLAPVIEEVAKAVGLFTIRDDDPEPEDGLIYGGVVGLGFAATENVVYVLGAFVTGGQEQAFATALFRTVATVGLHGAATAITGYGVWGARYGTRQGSWLVSLLGAVALHAGYNALVTKAGTGGAFRQAVPTLLAIVVALVAYRRILRRVRALDARSPAAWWSR